MNNQIFSSLPPRAYKRCPNSDKHKNFITGAAVCQDWVVDGTGNFIEVFDECTQVLHKPDTENEWTCADCGAISISI